jgi:hypothetical protein
MSLITPTVLERAPTRNLVDLATVRDRLLDGDTSEDALLAQLVSEASGAIADYLWGPGSNLGRQRYQATLAGTGRHRLNLPRIPLDPASLTVTIDDVALVAGTDYEVEDAAAGILWRGDRWAMRSYSAGEEPRAYIVCDWRGGWVLPDMLRTWATGLTLAAGDWLRPTSAALSPLLFEVTAAGASDAGTEPTWPTVAGETVAVGTATATARQADELPESLQSLAYVEVYHRYHQQRPGAREPFVTSLEAEGVVTRWAASEAESADLSPAVLAGLDRIADLRAA